MNETLLALSKIHKTYPGVHALNGVDMEIKAGEVHGLVGENGSGKSTLIKIVAGVVKPDAGSSIIIKGRRIESFDAAESLRNGIVAIFQHFSLFENLTVAENIVVDLLIERKISFINWRWIRRNAQTIIDKLGTGLDPNAEVASLPIAKRQLVAIGRAIICDAQLVIMDEPTSALSNEEIDRLFSIIRGLRDRGASVLFVSHKLDEVLRISDRITVLRDGQNQGETLVNSSALTHDTLASLMIGRRLSKQNYEFKPPGDIVLEVEDLTKKGNFKEVSFSLRKGEILGITGLLGSGKTELALALFGVNKNYAGNINLNGIKTRIRSPSQAKRLGICYISEERQSKSLILKKSIKANIVITVIDKIIGKLGLIKRSEADNISQQWIQKLLIKCSSMNEHVEHLSGGNQQRVVLSKWLATSPRVLILDNPTAGVDVAAKKEITDIIYALANQGLAIIYISPEIPDVLKNCSRILVMKKGRTIKEFDTANVTEEEVIRCQYT